MPTYEELYSFLKSHYKHERFEGRNDRDYPDYSRTLTEHRLTDLEKGYDVISRHESVTGVMIVFDQQLRELPGIPFPTPTVEQTAEALAGVRRTGTELDVNRFLCAVERHYGAGHMREAHALAGELALEQAGRAS
jgi:hypothetical protein